MEEFRRNYLEPERPVVVVGGVADWPAVKRWTDDYLRRVVGDVTVLVKPHTDYSGGTSQRENEAQAAIDISTLLTLMASPLPPELSYARESRLLADAPRLQQDISTPEYVEQSRPHLTARTGYSGPSAWLGPAGTVAQLHWDPEHNVYCQVRGRKYIVVVPPDDAACTYPNVFDVAALRSKPFFTAHDGLFQRIAATARESGPRNAAFREALVSALSKRELSTLCDYLLDTNNCHVNAEAPDLDAHPLFGHARRFDALLAPGDLLFLPRMWFHFVRALDASISINWFFLPVRGGDTPALDWAKRILLAHVAT
jgi:hypothetical protein